MQLQGKLNGKQGAKTWGNVNTGSKQEKQAGYGYDYGEVNNHVNKSRHFFTRKD